MRLTIKMQTAILFCLYLSRAGRATRDTAAENLGLDEDTLSYVAVCLLKYNVASVVDFEYSLIGHPTVGDVIKAVSPKGPLTSKEYGKLKHGQHEHRTLAHFASTVATTLDPFLKRTIRGISNDLIMAEMNKMDSARDDGRGN